MMFVASGLRPGNERRARINQNVQRARFKQATGLIAARPLCIDRRPGRNARALYWPQDWPQRARFAQATGMAAGQQRARSLQAKGLAASRALCTGHRTGRIARALYRPQDWPQRAHSAQATGLAAC